MTASERAEVITELRQAFDKSLRWILSVAGMSRSSYYYAIQDKTVVDNDAQVIQAIDDIRQTDPKYTKKYGYRRITDHLHELGFQINHKRVLRIMKEHQWLSTYNLRGHRKYNSYKGWVGRIAKNKLNRRFKTDRPYQKLVTDVSEFRYGSMSQSERLYLEPVMDLYSGEILAYEISEHPTFEFALKPLKAALDAIPDLPYRTTVHTDQGFQYQNKRWRQTLKSHHVFQSMSHKGTCLDNAEIESFFSVMKAEMMDIHYETKAELESAMHQWLDFYNNRRIKGRLKGKSPVTYRKLAFQEAA
ncbi:IS3 family transposase [Lacticaseibacillus saniviri]